MLTIASTDLAEIRTDVVTHNRALFSKRAFEPGEVISDFYWRKIFPEATYLTIQIGEAQHIELLPSFLECTNHSCDPNAFFDIYERRLVCIKPIANGDEITFFYPSSEWDMDRPFICRCGSEHCIGYIAGAKHLTKMQQGKYRFTGFIQQKLAKL
jgi:SET domain